MSNLFEPSLVFKPFVYPQANDITVAHEKIHWVETEADLIDDVADWKLGRVSREEKNFIVQILRLFTASDVLVGGFYYNNLIPRFLNNEVRVMLGSFANREGVHQRAYSLLNETLGLPASEYHAFLEYKEMADKADHMMAADTTTDRGLMLALAKGVANEGVSLFASFTMLLNFQRYGKMKGMGKIVEWSQRDESQHVTGLAFLFRAMAAEMPDVVTDDLKLTIYQMMRDTVALEEAFIDLAFEMGGITGLTKEDTKRYVRYVADRRLTQLGLKENWGVAENPLPWVDWLVSGADHTNFFEGKSTQYEVGSLQGDWDYPDQDPVIGWLIYTRDGCPHCDEAKRLLVQQTLPVTILDLSDDATRHAYFDAGGFSGNVGMYSATMPKVYRVGRAGRSLIGGCTELKTLIQG